MRLFVLFLVFFSSFAYPGGYTSAKINRILLYEAGNLVYVYPEGGAQDPAPCHGEVNGDYFTMDMSRPMAQEYLSLMMMAYAAKKNVGFKTSYPDCPEQPFVESIIYIWVND